MLFQIEAFWEAFPTIIKALPITISVAMLSMAAGLVLALGVTFLRRSSIGFIRQVFHIYVSFFRGTPLMVQMFLFFFGLPQLFPELAKINAYAASVVVMSINASAYGSEVIRSALNAVPKGQTEAALSIGLTRSQAMFQIILPQAMRIAVPPLGNTFINLIQGTSITFMLGLRDIMGASKMRAASTYRFFEIYLAVGLVYWILTFLAAKLNDYIEKQLTFSAERA